MEAQPATTNPFLIMLINMTIVFGVLWVLGLVMKLIYIVDPTRKKKEQEPVTVQAAPAAPVIEEAVIEQVDDKQLVAVIMATLSAYGCGKIEITSIRPMPNKAWMQNARMNSLRK